MPEIRITDEEIRYASLFESLTGIQPLDTVIDDEYNRIIFVVQKNMAALAVGKGGANIRRLRQFIGRDVEVVEHGESPEELIRNSLYPARVIAVKISKGPDGSLVAMTTVVPEDKAIAIGRNGKNVNRARILAKRYFDIDRVVLV